MAKCHSTQHTGPYAVHIMNIANDKKQSIYIIMHNFVAKTNVIKYQGGGGQPGKGKMVGHKRTCKIHK